MPPRPDATRRIVAISGGARGIGKATGEAFLRAGARVALGDIDQDLAERTAQELSRATGGQVCGLGVDVTDRPSFATFLDTAQSRLGPLDTVVNNAGIMPTGLFADEDDAMTDRMVAVNFSGVLIGSKLAVRRFAGRGGRIVNVASMAGVSSHRGVATYCGTKHAVVGFSAALRKELRNTGIRVTTVLPGLVRTQLSAGSSTPNWVRPVTEVGADSVAAGIVDAVVRGRNTVVIPRALGSMLSVMGMLPQPLSDGMERIARLDSAFTTVDPIARQQYHDRIVGVRP